MKRFNLAALVLLSAVSMPAVRAQKRSLTPVKIGIGASTCLAPVFVAHELGYFKREGIADDLLNGQFDTQKEQIATGKLQASLGLIDVWLKPIEQGLDIKFSAGVHFGCTSLLVRSNSNIRRVRDLRGKRIGITVFGDGATVFASRSMVLAGLNPRTDVTWKTYPTQQLELALSRGEVDAVGLNDPLAELAVRSGKSRALIRQSRDLPWKKEYCCLVGFNGAFARRNPKVAAAVTRAILNASVWVKAHPKEAAKILVSRKYIPSDDIALNAYLLTTYNYTPSVSGARRSILNAAIQSRKAGIIEATTDPVALTNHVFLPLPGLKKFK